MVRRGCGPLLILLAGCSSGSSAETDDTRVGRSAIVGPTSAPRIRDRDHDGFMAGEDCDDSDPTAHPGAYDPVERSPEDERDLDCNGQPGGLRYIHTTQAMVPWDGHG